MNDYIDAPVWNIINYFNSQMNSYLDVALMLGRIFCLLGILWDCFQMVFGTLEQRKFLVGTITKWFIFLLIMTIYPGVTRGLRHFSIQMANYVSGAKTNEIAQEFGNYLKKLEDDLKKQESDLDNRIAELKKAASENPFDFYNFDYMQYDPDSAAINSQIQSYEQTKQAISIDAEKPIGKAKTINAIKSVLFIDNESLVPKYQINLALIIDGQDTGYLSSNAIIRMTLLSAQIMWEKVWEDDVMVQWEENAKKGWIKKKQLIDFPFSKIFDIILCFLCEILMVAITCFELIQYTMCIIEFIICVTFGIVLVPCLLFDGLKDMAMKLLPSLLAQAVKLSMITICMYFCCYTFLDLARKTIADTAPFGITTFAYIVFTVLLTFALCTNAPKLASALLTGQPQMSMGEFVQAAGAIAGGAAVAAKGVELGRQAVGVGARAGANMLGGAAAMVGGAEGGIEQAEKEGKGAFGKGMYAMGGVLNAGVTRGINKARSGLQNAANYKGKGSGGGMGGSGGGGTNRFGSNDQGNAAHGRLSGMPEQPFETAQRNTMDYASHKTETGSKSTLGEYLQAQREAGRQTMMSDVKEKNTGLAVSNRENANKAASSKEVAVPNSPIYNFGSSTSYTPPMRNVTPKPEALPPSGLPSPSKRKFISGDIDGASDV